MHRPRWHDHALLATVIVALLGGVWVLWGGAIRSRLGGGSTAPAGAPLVPAPATPGST